jgi:hypothetical protein
VAWACCDQFRYRWFVPDPARTRSVFELGALAVLGAIAFRVAALIMEASSFPSVTFAVPLVLLVLIAGAVEAAAFARTNRRRRVWSWLAPIVGMFAMATAMHLAWSIRFGAGAAPDAGMGIGLAVVSFLVAVPIFAALVSVVAAIAISITRNRRA